MANENKKSYFQYIIFGIIFLAVMALLVALMKYKTSGAEGNRLSSDFNYSVDKEFEIDPAIITYRQAGPELATRFERSAAMAFDNEGQLYVAGDSAIHVFDVALNPAGPAVMKQLSVPGEPTALFVDGDTLYIALRNHVMVFDMQTGDTLRWPAYSEESILTAICVERDNVFVADAAGRLVLRYDKQGTLINTLGRKDKSRNIPGFVIPSPWFDMAVAPDGLLRVVNPGRHSIEAYTPRGDLEFAWGHYSPDVDGFCGCCNPVSLAILPNGKFVTAEKGLTRVKIHDADGNFETVVAGPAELLENTDEYKMCEFPDQCQKGGYDLAVRGERIFVLDTAKNIVRIFEKKNDQNQ